MSTEPVTPSTPPVHLKQHERIAAMRAAAKLKQSMRPATAARTPEARAAAKAARAAKLKQSMRPAPAARTPEARAAAKAARAAKLASRNNANPMLTPRANANAAPRVALMPRVAPVLPIVGFAEGTMISCKVGDVEQSVAVQDLRKGSLVKTSKGFHTVGIIGSRAVTIPESADRSADRLYTLSKDKFPTLTQDLTVSGRRAILVDQATNEEKKCTIDAMGRLSMIDDKFCLAVCAHADAALSSTVGATTLYNFSLDERGLRKAKGVYANGLLVDHSPSYIMTSAQYTRLQ